MNPALGNLWGSTWNEKTAGIALCYTEYVTQRLQGAPTKIMGFQAPESDGERCKSLHGGCKTDAQVQERD